MSIVVTGSTGLIGSAAASFFAEKGYEVLGVDNDMRSQFFGASASTDWNRQRLVDKHPSYRHHTIDIRDEAAVNALFQDSEVELVIHAAAQPSHDWAAKDPHVDFTVNADGTLVLLEATRTHCRDAVFIFTSTNKVYGDRPNAIPMVELETRWDYSPGHESGVDESMTIDASMHSLFGVSKVAADIAVQEYGRYFGLKTCCLRCGCFLLAIDRKFFLSFSVDLRSGRDRFRRLAHGHIGRREGVVEARIGQRVIAHHRDTGHGFNTGTDKRFTGIHLDRARRHVNGFHR